MALTAPLALVLTLAALFLPPVLLPPVAFPLPSAVAEAEPAPFVRETPPKEEVEAVVLGKEEKPKLAPAEGEVKLPTAGVPAACPGGGLESSAEAADDGLPSNHNHNGAAEHMQQALQHVLLTQHKVIV